MPCHQDKNEPVPTYFAYEIRNESIENNQILSNEIKQVKLPYFFRGRCALSEAIKNIGRENTILYYQ